MMARRLTATLARGGERGVHLSDGRHDGHDGGDA